ncbi:hypothetical protein AB0B45_06130 [Nonomuraea sp. NPDC049152]|uniref:hypothetical protein n=1 Tax=Nonomuraea sp. NPDC049152 TaxID=3154350 RepID=UPI0033E3556B
MMRTYDQGRAQSETFFGFPQRELDMYTSQVLTAVRARRGTRSRKRWTPAPSTT